MDIIHKDICLEDFKSRRFGYSMSIDGDFDSDDYNDYGKIPYDLIIPETDNLFALKSTLPLTKSNDKWVLRYHNMIYARKLLLDIIEGKTYESSTNEFVYTTKYYKLCKVNGVNEWVEMTDEMWESLNEGDDELSRQDKFFLQYSDGDYVVKGLYPNLPPAILYFYYNLDGDSRTIISSNYQITYYYEYYYSDSDGNILFGPKKSEFYPDSTTIYYYTDDEGEVHYYDDLNDIDGENYPKLSTADMYVKKKDYSLVSINGAFSVGDIIGVNANANEYNKKFCLDYELVRTRDMYISNKEFDDPTKLNLEDIELGETYKYIGDDSNGVLNGLCYTKSPAANRHRYDKDFLDKIYGLLYKKEYTKDDFVEPYFDLNFYIEEEFDDSGKLSPLLERWVANKKYKIGDIVIYNEQTYRLGGNKIYESVKNSDLKTALETFEKNGYVYDKVQITKEEYDINYGNLIQSHDSDGGYYLYTFYYKGYYSSKYRITYFDEIDSDENLIENTDGSGYTHWIKTYLNKEEQTDEEFTSICQSKIIDIKGIKASTDDNGNVLPFNFTFDVSGNVLSETKLVYMLGKSSITNNRCDFLSDIKIYYRIDGADTLLGTFEFQKDSSKYFLNYITVSQVEKLIGTRTGGTPIIEFTYYIGTILDSDNEYGIYCSINEKTGEIDEYYKAIKYVDRYTFEIDTYECNVSSYSGSTFGWIEYEIETEDVEEADGTVVTVPIQDVDASVTEMPEATSTNYNKLYTYIGITDSDYVSGNTYKSVCSFKYINISYDDTCIEGYTEKEDTDGITYSEVTIKKKLLSNDDFQEVDFFKDDSLIGIQTFNKDIDLYIDRGTSAASERIYALGSISTFTELEKYRGDMYDLQSQKEK